MTNSMNNIHKKAAESINSVKDMMRKHYNVNDFEEPIQMQIAFNIEKESVLDALALLKSHGFGQLSLLTCVDWNEDNTLQLVYILMNWDTGIHLQLRTFLDRDKPVFKTIQHIYPGVKYYERDVHEFFGVEFEGNEDAYKHLFLEMWTEAPPMLKDFDPVKYSDKKYSMREYTTEFPTKVDTKPKKESSQIGGK